MHKRYGSATRNRILWICEPERKCGASPVSPPRENVLFVPGRSFLLTRSGWGCDGPRSSDHDSAGARPAGGTQEGKEAADHAKAGSQGTGCVGTAGAAIDRQAERQRISG